MKTLKNLKASSFKNIKVDLENKNFRKNKAKMETYKKNILFIVFSIIYQLFPISLALIVVIFCERLTTTLKFDNLYFENLAKNWNSKLISNIYTTNCIESNSLLNNSWSGSSDGCNCNSYVSKNFCVDENYQSYCPLVPSIDPSPYLSWKGAKLCRERNSEWDRLNYFELNVKNNATACGNISRSCGIIDSFKNHLCVENNKSCPVISINIYDFEYFNKQFLSDNNDVTFVSPKAVFVYTKDESKFYNKSTPLIPVEFKISNGQPCMNPYYINSDGYMYILDNYYGRNFCLKYSINDDNLKYDTTIYSNKFFYDNNFKKVDNTNMTELLSENNILPMIKTLPFYPTNSTNRDISLYYRSYIGMNYTCYKILKENKFYQTIINGIHKISEITNQDYSGMRACYYAQLMACFFVLIIGILSLTLGIIRKDKPFAIYSSFVWSYFILFILSMIPAFILVSQLSSIYYSLEFSNESIKSVFMNPNCFESYTNEIYEIFWLRAKIANDLLIKNFILISVYLLLNLLFTIFLWVFKKSEY